MSIIDALELVRAFTVVCTSLTLGVAAAIAWRWRHRMTAPAYIKVVGVSYFGYLVFALAATQDAWRSQRPVTWITMTAVAASAAGVAGAVLAIRRGL